MATNFPTSLDSFLNPVGTDNLATVNHASQHDNINDAVAALEAKVGVNGSAVTSSLDYKINHISAGSSSGYFPQAAVIPVFDRALATVGQVVGGGGPTPGAYFVGFVAPASLTVSQMTAYVTTAGTSMGSNIAALYTLASNGDGTQVAVSAANTTWLGTLGKRTLAFTAPVTLVAGNAYAAVIFCTQGSGTQPQVVSGLSYSVATAVSQGVTQPYGFKFLSGTPGATQTFASLSDATGLRAPYLELS